MRIPGQIVGSVKEKCIQKHPRSHLSPFYKDFMLDSIRKQRAVSIMLSKLFAISDYR